MRSDAPRRRARNFRSRPGAGLRDKASAITLANPERVLEDYRDGYVSREAARDQYGVAITEDGEIDKRRTETLRAGQ